MLTGTKFAIFHKYVEDIMGRPVQTLELGTELVSDEIRERSRDDFIAICKEEQEPSVTPMPWISIRERLPEDGQVILAEYPEFEFGCYITRYSVTAHHNFRAWMPLPSPYQPEIPTGVEVRENE